jgi:hypothetical protein
MMLRAIVPLLCGGLLLISGAVGAGASQVNGSFSVAQMAAPGPAPAARCGMTKEKVCGGACPRKDQKCVKMDAKSCGCK